MSNGVSQLQFITYQICVGRLSNEADDEIETEIVDETKFYVT